MRFIASFFGVLLLSTLVMTADGKAGCRGLIECYDNTSGALVGTYMDSSVGCSWDFGCQVTSRSNVSADDCNHNVPACNGNCEQGNAVCKFHWG